MDLGLRPALTGLDNLRDHEEVLERGGKRRVLRVFSKISSGHRGAKKRNHAFLEQTQAAITDDPIISTRTT